MNGTGMGTTDAAQQLHDPHGTAHLLTICTLLDLEAIDEESSVSGAEINRRYEELVDASRYQQSTYKSLDRLVEHAFVAKHTGPYTNCYWLTEDGRGFVRSLEALFAERQHSERVDR